METGAEITHAWLEILSARLAPRNITVLAVNARRKRWLNPARPK